MLPVSNAITNGSRVVVIRRAALGTSIYLNDYVSASVPKDTTAFTYNDGWETTIDTEMAIRDKNVLRTLANDNNMLNDILTKYDEVNIYLKDGAWTPKIKLPDNANIITGARVLVHGSSAWSSSVYLDTYESATTPSGTSTFTYNSGWETALETKNSY